jgi:hypothetical protein
MRPVVALSLVVALALCVQAGLFFQTGHQWFEACWSRVSLSDQPATAKEAVAWARCAPVAEEAIYSAGFVFFGDYDSDSDFGVGPADPAGPIFFRRDPDNTAIAAEKAIAAACPSNMTDVPIGGAYFLTVDLIKKQGVRLIDRLIPSQHMIANAFETRWPACVSTRIANGYPKIVKKGDAWDWETPCEPCRAAAAARADRGGWRSAPRVN